MVHGAFCGGWVFDAFRAPFEAAGHSVVAPDLPGRGDEAVAGLSMADYARAVRETVAAMAAPPILIGHSLGGLAAQMAAQDLALKGLILLAPSAPWGVMGSSLEEAGAAFSLYALGPYWMQAVSPDRAMARAHLLDRLAPEQRRAAAARLCPESGRALFEALNWWLDPMATTTVSPARIRAPVLGVAGGVDPLHPPGTVRATTVRLGGEFETMAGLGHWMIGEPGWDALAQRCLTWIAAREVGVAA